MKKDYYFHYMIDENNEKSIEIPGKLKFWFTVHFIIDILFALPMFFIPNIFLTLLGWTTVDPLTARMTAAALFGIGIESLLSRNAGPDSFHSMLSLKIIWSSAAAIGLTIGLITGSFGIQLVGIMLLAIFLLFNILWTYWFIRIRRIIYKTTGQS